MAFSEDQLYQAVDEILGPVWPREQRRAAHRLALGAFGRWAGGMTALFALSLVLRLAVGLMLPWGFFCFMAVLAGLAAIPDRDDRSHLHRS
jgi:hypothetical protein